MRKQVLLALIFSIAVAATAQAQETYNVSASVAQVTRLTKAVTVQNKLTCSALALAATCTQAQACTAAVAAGGAACTAAQARAGNVRIYPNTQPGREEFVTFALVVPAFQQLVQTATSTDQADFCKAFKLASQGTNDGTCTTYGLPAACEICP